LEALWERCLVEALGRHVDPHALSIMVARQSARYRGEAVPLAAGDSLAARTLFWLPRDLRKVALPIHELLAAGVLPSRPLRVLDLGAGTGATCLGVLRALRGVREVAHVTAVDNDPRALALLRRVAEGAARAGLLPPIETLLTEHRDLTVPAWRSGLGGFDLVTIGFSLVEFTRAETDRAASLARFLTVALEHLVDDGALIVLEPATREEARALQGARDLLVAQGVTVFAPCPHTRPCPMLHDRRDWCHEDLPEVGLPPWLVPIARAAGLRWEGLTFAYLTLRRDDRTFASSVVRPGRRVLRLLSAPIVTKGKTEIVACGDLPGERASVRLMELSRDAKRSPHALAGCARGEVITLDDTVVASPRGTVRLDAAQWSPHDDHGLCRSP
jgi:SAM-dependent methyltransferase